MEEKVARKGTDLQHLLVDVNSKYKEVYDL